MKIWKQYSLNLNFWKIGLWFSYIKNTKESITTPYLHITLHIGRTYFGIWRSAKE